MIIITTWKPLTISILIIVTFITQPVLIGIFLWGIFHTSAVVTGIAMEILIAVPLIHIGNKPTIVLRQMKGIYCEAHGVSDRKFLFKEFEAANIIAQGSQCFNLPTSMLAKPSLSASSSQASPIPSPSASSCPEFGTYMQLSWKQHSKPHAAFLFMLALVEHMRVVGLDRSTFLQFLSLHWSLLSGYPSISVSFPHTWPLPAQPTPH